MRGVLSVQLSFGLVATLGGTILALRMLRRGEERVEAAGLIPRPERGAAFRQPSGAGFRRGGRASSSAASRIRSKRPGNRASRSARLKARQPQGGLLPLADDPCLAQDLEMVGHGRFGHRDTRSCRSGRSPSASASSRAIPQPDGIAERVEHALELDLVALRVRDHASIVRHLPYFGTMFDELRTTLLHSRRNDRMRTESRPDAASSRRARESGVRAPARGPGGRVHSRAVVAPSAPSARPARAEPDPGELRS